jgi:hypothetical protein
MNWYIVKLVFQVVSGKGIHKPQFDEQLRMISALDPAGAYQKARVLGIERQEHFNNNKGETVYWKFIAVTDVDPIGEFKDGVQLFASTHETDDELDYVKTIEQKSNFTQTLSQLRTIHI